MRIILVALGIVAFVFFLCFCPGQKDLSVESCGWQRSIELGWLGRLNLLEWRNNAKASNENP